MTTAPLSTLEAIAQRHLGLETLETRHGDSLDFKEQGVWQIRAALAAAFAAGAEAAMHQNLAPKNPNWGFAGGCRTAGLQIEAAWKAAIDCLIRCLGISASNARDVLDSRVGRHLADQIAHLTNAGEPELAREIEQVCTRPDWRRELLLTAAANR